MGLQTVTALAIVAVFCGISYGQVPGKGKCPDVDVEQDFDVGSYQGVWYEYERFFAAFEIGNICGQANYTLKRSGKIGVRNMGLNKWTHRVTSVEGEAYAPDPNVKAKLVVSFPSVPGPFAKGNYWVLATDYDSYAVVWSCADIDLKLFDLHGSIAWILTRKRGVLDAELRQEIYNKFKSYGINPNYFKRVDQSDCPSHIKTEETNDIDFKYL